MYVWKKQILTSIIKDDASRNNKRISLFHVPLLSSMFNLLCLPSSCFFVILFHCCWSNAQVLGTTFVHEFHIPIAIQNVTCFYHETIQMYHETRWSLLIGRRFACEKQTTIIIKNSCCWVIFFYLASYHHKASIQSVFE